MGTLTADIPRLASYCPHKLPTSCRLSSIPECCACADERSHAVAYSTYIDGVGYVLRGSRWQRYCWFCKEFWENRVRASGLVPHQTRIPQEPDQQAFLDRWYEFHQGYRIVTKEDGTQERIAVNGEDFRDVSPGCMPRTTEELRAGVEHSAYDVPVETQAQPIRTEELENTLDEQLDELWREADAEEDPTRPIQSPNAQTQTTQSSNIHAQAMTATQTVPTLHNQARRVAALRRELYRMRNGIERVIAGLRELGAAVPDHEEATERLGNLTRYIGSVSGEDSPQDARLAIESVQISTTSANTGTASISTRVDEARTRTDEARRMRNQAATELQSADQELASAQRRLHELQLEQRTTENYVRIFGTREDIVAQGDDYESPIGGFFSQAWERFRQAEDTRREERMLRRYLADEQASGGEEQMQRLAEIENMRPDVWGVPQSIPQSLSQNSPPSQGVSHADTGNTTQLMEMARDEVFDGASVSQDAVVSDLSPSSTSDPQQVLDRVLRQGLSPPSDLVGDSASPSSSTISAHSELYVLNDDNLAQDLRYILDRCIAIQSATLVNSRNGNSDDVNLGTLFDDYTLQDLEAYRERLRTADADLHTPLAEHLIADENVVWGVGLPREWFRRADRERRPLGLTMEPGSDGREEQRQNIEAMAGAFMTSSQVRRSSRLIAPQQLQMLYRLQRTFRNDSDRAVLWRMLNDPEAVHLARTIITDFRAGMSSADQQRLVRSAELRAARARHNMVSRNELDEHRRRAWEQLNDRARMSVFGAVPPVIQAMRRNAIPDEEPAVEDEAVGLDADDERPAPRTDEDMTLKMDCAICYSQVADTACLPCGHLVMCRWCSDQHSPTYSHDRTRPRRPANCPVCRKHIKQKVRVYRA